MRAFIIIITLLCLTGCDFIESVNNASKLKTTLEELNLQVSAQSDVIDKQYELIASLVIDLEIEKNKTKFLHNTYYHPLVKIFPLSAQLTPATEDFSTIFTTIGTFAVSFVDIKNFSTGSDIQVGITNLMGVNITNIEVLCEYSNISIDLVNDTDITFDDYIKSRKNTKTTIKEIPAGKEVVVSIKALDYKPEQIKEIEIKLNPGGISYQRIN